MKKLLPVLVVVAILSVGGYLMLNKPKSNKPQSSMQQASEASEWSSAIASGRPTTCTMTKGEEKMQYLIKGKKMKVTMQTMVESAKSTSYMINDEKYVYIWEDGQTQGTKMAIPTEEEVKKMTADAQKYSNDLPETPDFDSESGFDTLKNDGYVINCESATASDSDFIAPTTVTFVDPTAMMNALPATDPDGKIDMSQIEAIKKQYGGEVPANY